ncbi:MAG: TPM domain-containing protein [Clostridiales bacterium]|nr:TPM domain-containing protein [Clostridiales bacterium]
MKNFYNKTGVQPYLYLTDNIYGSTNPNDTQVEQFADALYEELFTDEAHVLLIFMEYAESKYRVWCYAGMQAGAVIDAEARDILLGYINKYYTYENLSNEAYFSKAFNDAANRIMKVTVSPWVGVFVVLGLLLIVILLFLWWNRSKAQKNLEAAQTEKILKTPLDTFGGEAAELAKKYEDKDKNKR